MRIEYRGLRWEGGRLSGDRALRERLLAVLKRGANVLVAEPDGRHVIPPNSGCGDYLSVEAAFVLLASEDGARPELRFQPGPEDQFSPEEDSGIIH